MCHLLSTIIPLFISVLVFGSTLLSATSSVHAATIFVYPIEDTHIDSDNPNDNYVGHSFFNADKAIFNSELFPHEERIGLLKFDLSNKIRKGSTVNSAVLRLKSFYVTSPTPHIGIYRYSNDNWDPVTVTWNNFPAGTYQYMSEAAIPYEDQYYFWDVLPALNGEILSFAVKSIRTEEGFEILDFYSVNWFDESDWPILIVDYTPPPSKGLPWLLLLLEDED